MRSYKLWTKVEEPADTRVLVPYVKATEKVQAVIDCLRLQFIQPEVVKVDEGDAYWRMLRDAWALGKRIGIRAEDIPRVLEPFGQVERAVLEERTRATMSFT